MLRRKETVGQIPKLRQERKVLLMLLIHYKELLFITLDIMMVEVADLKEFCNIKTERREEK